MAKAPRELVFYSMRHDRIFILDRFKAAFGIGIPPWMKVGDWFICLGEL